MNIAGKALLIDWNGYMKISSENRKTPFRVCVSFLKRKFRRIKITLTLILPDLSHRDSLPEFPEDQQILPFEKYRNNPIISTTNLLAENIVYDKAAQKYWMVFSDFNDHSIGLACSSDLVNWRLYENNPVLAKSGDGWDDLAVSAPHLLYDNAQASYYLYYAGQNAASRVVAIGLAQATQVTGPYQKYKGNPILWPKVGWESMGIHEPYVMHDSKQERYIMFYMGNSTAWVEPTEQIGYAIALSPEGPWERFPGNPVLRFDSTPYDSGTIADPAIYYQGDTWYIFYSCSSTKHLPWRIAYATSTDLISFVKRGIGLDLGPIGSWDHRNAHRGAVQRFGDYLYLSYTGWPYRLGMAKMPASELGL
jgi:predicted GH43/DUF377 family glycosyl hydrolase